jgi:hypothetical protein
MLWKMAVSEAPTIWQRCCVDDTSVSIFRRDNRRLVGGLKLSGTRFERSPALVRSVVDLRQALELEGWQPRQQPGDGSDQ